MTSLSSATHNLFDRPELLENQTRLVISADNKPRRLIRSSKHSACTTTHERERSYSAVSTSNILEINDDNDDEYDGSHDDDGDVADNPIENPVHYHDKNLRQFSLVTIDIDYDTDIEQDEELARDYSCKGLYLDQCHRHGIIPSKYFLKHMNDDILNIRHCGLKPINVKVMIPALKMNTTITRLDLRDNGLGSRGALYVSQVIKDNEYMIELNLADNNIGLQGRHEYCRLLIFIECLRVNLIKSSIFVYIREHRTYRKYVSVYFCSKTSHCFLNEQKIITKATLMMDEHNRVMSIVSSRY
jgi:hypothetical protein